MINCNERTDSLQRISAQYLTRTALFATVGSTPRDISPTCRHLPLGRKQTTSAREANVNKSKWPLTAQPMLCQSDWRAPLRSPGAWGIVPKAGQTMTTVWSIIIDPSQIDFPVTSPLKHILPPLPFPAGRLYRICAESRSP